ncbi:MAG TPA: acetyl-CoA acetyltransferase [Acidimicrobiales bacterium]|nr:acetyl-CoA acetyltransferase [Acidimicrobiales bacterium]
MPLDPRTPVIVGVGQLTRRPPNPASPEWVLGADEPVDMMAEALRRAGQDSGGGDALLARADRVAVVALMSWSYRNPALMLAERLGASPADLVLTGTGGNSPQGLVDQTAADILAGQLDVALLTGVEAMYTRRLARQHQLQLAWTTQGEDTPEPRRVGPDRAGTSEAELAIGMVLPIQIYPLFENALRAAAGEGIEEHQVKISKLYARFSDVAAGNPYAWSPEALSAEEIRTPGPGNRMVGFPYPIHMNSNIQVDQAAAVVMCSVEAARAAGVPEDRWVFPRSGGEAHDHWFVSERDNLHSSPAIRLCGEKAFELDGSSIDDVAHVDLYSCFPCAVQFGAEALGLGLEEADRPLTVTGGLQFFGGPGNNYVMHSIASMCERLRRDPGSLGLVSALGWYATKHAVGLYSTTPPAGAFRFENVQEAVHALPSRRATNDAEGETVIETYTVMHERDGQPGYGIVTAILDDGTRALAKLEDRAALDSMLSTEGCGRPLRLLGQAKAELI